MRLKNQAWIIVGMLCSPLETCGWRSAKTLCVLDSLQEQRGNDHEDADRWDIPDKRTGQRQIRRVQNHVDYASPKKELSAPYSQPAVRVCHGNQKNCRSKKWERLEIVSERSFDPSCDAGKRQHGLLSRASRPPIAALPALQVRHGDDVHDADSDACGEQDEFDGHARDYTDLHVGHEGASKHARIDRWG